ncbi:ABC transporter substrate-binding protein [Emergencia timonensis]|uniref:ABC transporter substrate-binding protein n=1 Tax=Emergencia timonensis TaxID=1776384 RepID=UPI002495A033|nr:ABC transporter substrate-binding protein [Emergencia timonensis]
MKEKLVKQIAALLIVFVLLLGVSACSNPGGEGTDVKSSVWVRIIVTDQAGRDVTISERPQRIASGYYISTSLLLALGCQNRLVGIEAKAEERNIYALAAPEIIDLPNMGSAKDFNLEACIALKPDLVILPKKLQEPAKALEELGISVLLINPESDALLQEAIRLLGSAVGEEEKSEALLECYEETNEKLAASIKNADTPSIYLAGNSDMLRTCPGGMYQNTLIKSAGGRNVAEAIEGDSWAGISYEQLLNWNPDYIIIAAEASYTAEDLRSVPELANLKAVKENHVLTMPSDFEAWDAPAPSGILGKLWLLAALHPEAYSLEEFQEDVSDFYDRFYGFTVDKELLTVS